MVEYEKGQLLKNGSVRKTVWYNCCPKGAQVGSDARTAGHRRAEELAWKHVEAVANAREDAAKKGDSGILRHNVQLRVGLGELSGSGVWRFHGDPHQSFKFCSHRKRADPSIGSGVWRPSTDTLNEGRAHCTSAVFVRS